MRIALGLEYDGFPFSGWQTQPGGNTVQDALERALAEIAGAPVRVVCAGRTDAGVHAAAQVVHFDVPARRPENAWVRGANAHLPDSISVRWSRVVPGDFHARFSARSRSYRYVLFNHAVRPALLHGKVGWFHLPLDAEAMRAGAALLVGEKDFSAFRAAECQAKSPVKTLHRADVTCQGDLIVFDFCASAFLDLMSIMSTSQQPAGVSCSKAKAPLAVTFALFKLSMGIYRPTESETLLKVLSDRLNTYTAGGELTVSTYKDNQLPLVSEISRKKSSPSGSAASFSAPDFPDGFQIDSIFLFIESCCTEPVSTR